MRRISSIITGLALTALVAADATAQWNLARSSTTRKQVYTTFGLDPALVTSVGMSAMGTLLEHDFQVRGEAGLVTAGTDVDDFRTRLGLQTAVLRWRSMRVTGSATAIVRGTRNDVYRGINFGADVSGGIGVYRQRWFAAGEFGKDKAIITRVIFTDWYRNNVYPDAKDGWYLDAGGTYHYGVAGGVTIRNAELMTRVGFLKTERYNQMMPPGYVSVGMGFGF